MNNASLELGGTNWAEKDGNILGYSVGDTSGKYFPQEFTFARGSNLAATRIGKTGLIEKGRENLLLQSNQFDTTWVLTNAPTLTSGQAGYDGSNDAWKLEASTTGSSRSIHQVVSSSGVQVFSVYVKAGTTDWIRINLSGVGNRYFDIGNGVVGGSGSMDGFITDVGGGWYRCSVLGNGSSTAPYVFLASDNGNLSVNAGDYIYIQDAQLEQGLVATDVISTTTTTAQAGVLENTPRLNYTTGVANPYLLLEPSRTNLIAQSEYFGASDWVKTGLTIASNQVMSPDGNLNGTEVTISNGSHFLFDIISVSPSTTYTFSWYAKRGTATNVSYSVYDDTNSADIIPSTSYYSQLSDTEWKRISVQFTTSATTTSARPYVLRDGGQTGTISIYGAQLEAGSYATSYIPTYSVSATRAVDSCIDGGSAKSINSTEGVLYAEISALANDSTQRAITLSDGGNTNRVCLLYNDSSNSIRLFVQVGGSTQASVVSTSYAITDFNKIAIKWKANDFALWINGVEAGTDNTGVSFTSNTLNTLDFRFPNDTTFFYGNVKQVLTFNTALSDAELATLTTI